MASEATTPIGAVETDRRQVRLADLPPDMVVVQAEIDETFEAIRSQHTQLRFYTATYLSLVFGLVTLGGFVSRDVLGPIGGGVLIGATLLQFAVGWLYLSILGHKLTTFVMLYRHLAKCRSIRLSHASSKLQAGYVWPIRGNRIYVLPEMAHWVPLMCVMINTMIAAGGVYFGLYKLGFAGFEVTAIGSGVLVVMGHFYPRVWVSYFRHEYAVADARTLKEKRRLMKKFDRKRAKHRPKAASDLYSVLALLSVILAAVAPSLRYVEREYWGPWIAIAAIVILVLFAFLQVYIELVSTKKVRPTWRRHVQTLFGIPVN